MRDGIGIEARIGGEAAPRDAVVAWEARRRALVMRRMGLPVSGDAARDQARLLARKLDLGLAGVRRARAVELWIGDRVGGLASRLASGRRKFSVCEITADRGDARAFAAWFMREAASADPTTMLRACPDHLGFGVDAEGRQIVVETTGGSPSPTQFIVDYARHDGLRTPADPAFPVQVAGVATSLDGALLGGVRHQFRNVGRGFQARLTVEFPASTPDRLIHEHRWHLACEFSNWIEMAPLAGA